MPKSPSFGRITENGKAPLRRGKTNRSAAKKRQWTERLRVAREAQPCFARPIITNIQRRAAVVLSALAITVARADVPPGYEGRPFADRVHGGGAQRIPGPVFCAYYDQGGEGVAYHDTDSENQGSGKLNPADGSYLNEFRRNEGVDISYTKPLNDLESPCNRMKPPLGLLYVGWNKPGEWFKITVVVAEAGDYVADLLYTSQRGGAIEVDVDGSPAIQPIVIESTFDAAETIPWRQWHHWNVMRDAVVLHLPKGPSVLTVRILKNGEMNLATFNFRGKGTVRMGPDITALTTALPASNKAP